MVSLKVTGISRVVLAQLESPLDLTEHVTKLCLASYDPSFSSCWVSGTSGSSYTKTVSTSVSRCEDKLCLGPGDVEEGDSGGIFSFSELSLKLNKFFSTETVTWSGVLTCSSSPGVYTGVGVYSNPSLASPLTDLAPITSIINWAASPPASTDTCKGFR